MGSPLQTMPVGFCGVRDVAPRANKGKVGRSATEPIAHLTVADRSVPPQGSEAMRACSAVPKKCGTSLSSAFAREFVETQRYDVAARNVANGCLLWAWAAPNMMPPEKGQFELSTAFVPPSRP